MLLLLGLSGKMPAQVAATEEQIKAAYMLNFAKFVEWPADALPTPDSPLNFCELGRSQTADEMDSFFRDKSINGHAIKVRRLAKPEDIRDCHMVFVTAGNIKQTQQALQAAKGRPVLIVGDAPGFARSGGMIGFITENGKVLFEVNPGSAEQSHLKISSKLLALARIVSATEHAAQ